jgi:hypothetical protein
MIDRFDHAVIGLRDLAAGMDAFRQLGFEVTEGGRHPALGTRNAIVRFGLDYLEILSVEHPEVAQGRGPFGRELLSFVERSSGLVAYVLAGAGLQQHAEGFRELGVGAEGPFEMDRIRPDGKRLEWRLVVPGRTPWRKSWPYLIDWITPEADLLAWDPPAAHPCGVTGVAGIDVVVDDLAIAACTYRRGLNLQPEPGPEPRDQTAFQALTYRIGSFLLRLIQPTTDGSEAQELRHRGAGPFRLILATPDLTATAKALTTLGVSHTETPTGLDLDPADAAGTRIRIASL